MTTHQNPAAVAERARMAAIMALPEAKAHSALAGHLAVTTSMAPEAVQKTLAAAGGGGTFAHLNTPQAKAGIERWQRGGATTPPEDAAAQVLAAGGPNARRGR